MLKPVDPPPVEPPAGKRLARAGANANASERPVGELVNQLIDDAKAYARAEFELVKAIGRAKASALALPAALFGAAFVFALAAITALGVGVVLALATLIGPLLAGLAGMLIFVAIAGGLTWFALRRLKDMP